VALFRRCGARLGGDFGSVTGSSVSASPIRRCCWESEQDFCSLLGHGPWWWDFCYRECGAAESEDDALACMWLLLPTFSLLLLDLSSLSFFVSLYAPYFSSDR
jgi:hypothetical protein